MSEQLTQLEKLKKLQSLTKEINKKYGAGTITSAAEHLGATMVRVPTDILSLDIALGGGLVKNTISLWYGKKSSGKTTLNLKTIANIQKRGGVCAYIYTEGQVDSKHLESCGVDLSTLQLAQLTTSEDVIDLVQALTQSKAVDYILVDSLQGMVPTMVLERSARERTMGVEAFMNGKLVKKFNAATAIKAGEEPWCHLSLIAHGAVSFESGYMEVKGGEGPQFFAVHMIEVKATDGLTEDGTVIQDMNKKAGHVINFKIKKNKTFPPFKSGAVNYYTSTTNIGCGRGDIDDIQDIVNCGTKYDLIKSGGAWVYAPDVSSFRAR